MKTAINGSIVDVLGEITTLDSFVHIVYFNFNPLLNKMDKGDKLFSFSYDTSQDISTSSLEVALSKLHEKIKMISATYYNKSLRIHIDDHQDMIDMSKDKAANINISRSIRRPHLFHVQNTFYYVHESGTKYTVEFVCMMQEDLVSQLLLEDENSYGTVIII